MAKSVPSFFYDLQMVGKFSYITLILQRLSKLMSLTILLSFVVIQHVRQGIVNAHVTASLSYNHIEYTSFW